MLSPTRSIPGLVWAYYVDPAGGTAIRLEPDGELPSFADGNGFLWLHLNLVDTRVSAFLDDFPGLSAEAHTALTTHETHAAVTVDEQLAFGTLVDFQREFDAETRDIGWLHFALSDRFIITSRLQPIRSIDRVRAALEKNPGKCGNPMQLFEMLVAEFQRGLIKVVMEMTEELNAIEDIVYDSELRDERRQLASVRRVVVRLYRHLRTLLSLMRRAAASDEEDMPFGFDEVARRLCARLESVDHDVHALQERARLLHEEIDSKLSSETNRHLYILSLMTAFLLPASLVTGFFGMNTTGLPFADGLHGTLSAFGFIAFSVFLSWLVLRRAGIL
ncbi:transporter [Ciceribacter sp. L1K22]|uniref:transporter n=1 Tax=Ciceribacter sp. L1K22 TaxID=2820275 RepID=UPI001ABE94C9|nr:transporter [Ciceribacter sp. L1K22]MBO3759112.1 transporter [Ciceribacter sp. L1K22]